MLRYICAGDAGIASSGSPGGFIAEDGRDIGVEVLADDDAETAARSAAAKTKP